MANEILKIICDNSKLRSSHPACSFSPSTTAGTDRFTWDGMEGHPITLVCNAFTRSVPEELAPPFNYFWFIHGTRYCLNDSLPEGTVATRLDVSSSCPVSRLRTTDVDMVAAFKRNIQTTHLIEVKWKRSSFVRWETSLRSTAYGFAVSSYQCTEYSTTGYLKTPKKSDIKRNH